MEKKYFVYNDTVFHWTVLWVKTDDRGNKMYTFHKPKSKALWDNIVVFSLYVADDVDSLRNNIISWAKSLTLLNSNK